MIHATNIRDVGTATTLFDRASRALLDSPYRRCSVEVLPARGRLLVTGDLHDNPAHLVKILKLAQLGKSRRHHVVLQELIHGDNLVNGLDFSHQMLAKIAELVLTHPGQVHPILANHEMAQMTGKEVAKHAGKRVGLFNQAIEFMYGPDWKTVRDAVERFIGAMPLALRTESGLLCSHSLPSAKVMRRFDPRILERDLRPFDFVGPGGSAYEMVWGREYDTKSVHKLAQEWGVRLFCVGHEHVESGVELRFGNVIVLNSDHDGAAVLPVDLTHPLNGHTALEHAVQLSSVRAARGAGRF